MRISCPQTTYARKEVECSVTIDNPLNYTLNISYGNNQSSSIIAYEFPFIFKVNYSFPGHYVVRVNTQNHLMNVQKTIYGNQRF